MTTPQAAKRLGVSYSRLLGWIRYGRMSAPAKDATGSYVWTSDDIEAAKKVMQTPGRRGFKQ